MAILDFNKKRLLLKIFIIFNIFIITYMAQPRYFKRYLN
nr:MAG TPA: hypothetical protein [Caudoviricetes sp.]